MIFLIDENLSPRLVELHQYPHRAIHINQLKPNKQTVIKDDFIRKLSMDHPFILVTKDDDFVRSWVDRKVPEKMIFVFDNFKNIEQLIEAYKTAIPFLEKTALQEDFVEFSDKGIRTPFSDPLPYDQAED